MDALERLTDDQLYLLSEDIKLQLEKGAGTRPIVYLLAAQRRRAVLAINGIINADPGDAKLIAGYQAEAKLYYDLIENTREILNRGREADMRLAEDERAAVETALDQMSPEERQALNIEPKGDD